MKKRMRNKDPIKSAYSNDLDIFDEIVTGIIIILLVICIISKIVK